VSYNVTGNGKRELLKNHKWKKAISSQASNKEEGSTTIETTVSKLEGSRVGVKRLRSARILILSIRYGLISKAI